MLERTPTAEEMILLVVRLAPIEVWRIDSSWDAQNVSLVFVLRMEKKRNVRHYTYHLPKERQPRIDIDAYTRKAKDEGTHFLVQSASFATP